MTIKQHVLVALFALFILIFELINFTSILGHPYMTFILMLAGFTFGYHVTFAIMKKLKQ